MANRRKIAPESIQRFRSRVRRLTRRNWSISLEERVERLSPYLRGWMGYFGYCETSWTLSYLPGVEMALSNDYFDRLGVPRLVHHQHIQP